MAISMRSVIAGLIKLILFFAFYMAGWLTNSQLNQYTIVSQQDRINELNRRATSNTENLKQLERISSDIESLKKEVQQLHGLHNTKEPK